MTEHRVVVAAHGHCFDGLTSAVLFTHLRGQLDPRPVTFSYRSCGYGPTMGNLPERWFTGSENAIVDFRYSPSERLSWFFDHHATAFRNDDERDQALRRSKRFFFDPSYGSCSKLIADVGEQRFGIDFAQFHELIAWADRIDQAHFDSAEQAIDRRTPVMQLAAVVEQQGDGGFYAKMAPKLLAEPVSEVAASDLVRSRFAPIAAAFDATRSRIADRLERHGDIALADLHDAPLHTSGKFIAYALAPDCVYSVALLRMRQHYKISVGYNPWSPHPRRHDIGELCQQHGGGGHPVVGAVSLPLDKLADARKLLDALVRDLRR